MSIYLVQVEHRLHTCPAEPRPHPVDTRCTVLHVTPGRPCAAPVTIRCGDAVVVVPCGRHNPADQRCGNCRTIIDHRVNADGDRVTVRRRICDCLQILASHHSAFAALPDLIH